MVCACADTMRRRLQRHAADRAWSRRCSWVALRDQTVNSAAATAASPSSATSADEYPWLVSETWFPRQVSPHWGRPLSCALPALRSPPSPPARPRLPAVASSLVDAPAPTNDLDPSIPRASSLTDVDFVGSPCVGPTSPRSFALPSPAAMSISHYSMPSPMLGRAASSASPAPASPLAATLPQHPSAASWAAAHAADLSRPHLLPCPMSPAAPRADPGVDASDVHPSANCTCSMVVPAVQFLFGETYSDVFSGVLSYL